MWEKRQVGRTKLQVTTLGLGTATMGGSRIPVTRAEGEAIVTAAWDAGVRYVDTAPFYGVGAAEHRVGDAMREREPRELGAVHQGRASVTAEDRYHAVSGRPPVADAVRRDLRLLATTASCGRCEDSYQRLGLARIDILYVHDIGVYQHGEELNAAVSESAARERLQGAGGTPPHRRRQRHRHRRQRESRC